MSGERVFRVIFLGEAVVNLGTAVFATAAPQAFLAQFTGGRRRRWPSRLCSGSG